MCKFKLSKKFTEKAAKVVETAMDIEALITCE